MTYILRGVIEWLASIFSPSIQFFASTHVVLSWFWSSLSSLHLLDSKKLGNYINIYIRIASYSSLELLPPYLGIYLKGRLQIFSNVLTIRT